MKPKEKAKDLIMKMSFETHAYNTKSCALAAVDEILNNFGNLTDGKQHYCAYATIQYYKEVKQEIQKL